ncbi:MAG TPA: bacillithiol biosynthesis deacetylase BshB1 [Candidatus Krumholzibacteria bacterium]|nr:bacillithiol biosynthesis deacetylase BshB1 [Candidatus Krumholzibacteria bacterium]
MRIMAIGIHPDDVEIGCGGTVAVCAAAGDEVTIVDLTRGEASTNGTPEERAREAAEAARILGAKRRDNAGLPDAGVRSEDGGQTNAVVAMIRAYRPHILLVPNPDDAHPDHASGGMLIQRAAFLSNVNGYVTERDGKRQERWLVGRMLVYSGRREVQADIVVDITPHYETKLASVRAHASQVGGGKGALPTRLNDGGLFRSVEGRALVAGRRIGVTYGEAFQILAPIGLKNFSALAPES